MWEDVPREKTRKQEGRGFLGDFSSSGLRAAGQEEQKRVRQGTLTKKAQIILQKSLKLRCGFRISPIEKMGLESSILNGSLNGFQWPPGGNLM